MKKRELNEFELDEPLNPTVKPVCWVVGIAVVVINLLQVWQAGEALDGELLLILGTIWAFYAVCMWGLLALVNRSRFKVDGEGVGIHPLWGKRVTLRWQDVRTAAIVQMSGRGDMHWITLSPKQPEEVLLKKRFHWTSGKKDGEVRVVYTEKRREAIEHWLDRELPEFGL